MHHKTYPWNELAKSPRNGGNPQVSRDTCWFGHLGIRLLIYQTDCFRAPLSLFNSQGHSLASCCDSGWSAITKLCRGFNLSLPEALPMEGGGAKWVTSAPSPHTPQCHFSAISFPLSEFLPRQLWGNAYFVLQKVSPCVSGLQGLYGTIYFLFFWLSNDL